jgi:hypothetical protein
MHDTLKKQFADDDNLWSRETKQWWPTAKKKTDGTTPVKPFRKLDNWHAESYRLKAVRKHVREQVPIRQRKRQLAKLTSGITYDDRHQLVALNPHASTLFADHLDHAIKRTKTTKPAHAVTLISPRFNVDWNGRWPKLDAVREWIADNLEGFSYLMLIQVGFRRITDIERDESGRRGYTHRSFVCLHAHGLVWGDEAEIEERFRDMPHSLGAPGGHRQPLRPGMGWFEYAAGDPRHVETRRKRWLQRGYEPGLANLTLKLEAKLVRYLHGVTKPDLCVAAGLGRKVLRRSIKQARAEGFPD